MRTIHRCILPGLLVCVTPWLNAREIININPAWEFFAGADTTSAPVSVNLPHDFQISQPWIAPGEDEKADLSNGVANIKKSTLGPRIQGDG